MKNGGKWGIIFVENYDCYLGVLIIYNYIFLSYWIFLLLYVYRLWNYNDLNGGLY